MIRILQKIKPMKKNFQVLFKYSHFKWWHE